VSRRNIDHIAAFVPVMDIKAVILKDGAACGEGWCGERNGFPFMDQRAEDLEKGLFIAMPSRKASDGEYRDIAHPINSATREQIQTIILDKYQEVMAEEAENEVLMEAAE